MVKIAIIGAGSTVFMKNIVTDIVLEPGLARAHIALHDIDEKRLDTSLKVAQRIAETTATAPHLSATLNRRAALQNADLSSESMPAQHHTRAAPQRHGDSQYGAPYAPHANLKAATKTIRRPSRLRPVTVGPGSVPIPPSRAGTPLGQ